MESAGEQEREALEMLRRFQESDARSRLRRASAPSRRRGPRMLAVVIGFAASTPLGAPARLGQDEAIRPGVSRGAATASADVETSPSADVMPDSGSLASARRFAASRAGFVSFAVIDSSGRQRGFKMQRPYVSASVVKALLLAAEVHRLELARQPLDSLTSDLLARMITYSDNPAADAIYQRVGDHGLRAVAVRAGMRDFAVYGHWTTAEITAADMARFMTRLDALLAGPHRPFASRLLASIVEEQRWGIPAAFGKRWRVRFKGGWRSTELGELVHQAATLQRDGRRFSLAILTDGQPTTGYGIATISDIAARLNG